MKRNAKHESGDAAPLSEAMAVATSADEEVVCEGEKTREERDAELRGEAVSLDE